MKRFATGAMSFGSISWEVHTTLAKAMNKVNIKVHFSLIGIFDLRMVEDRIVAKEVKIMLGLPLFLMVKVRSLRSNKSRLDVLVLLHTIFQMPKRFK